jgi:hypothetical protein
MPGYVQKLRASVRVALAGDPPLDGVFCLAPWSRTHDGPQTLLELLNGSSRLVPLELPDDGSVRLLTRAAIEWVAPHAGVDPRLQRPGGTDDAEEPVLLRLHGGAELEGLLQLERLGEFNRASDYLNRVEDFFAVETRAGLVLVNKLRIREVRVFAISPLPMTAGTDDVRSRSGA